MPVPYVPVGVMATMIQEETGVPVHPLVITRCLYRKFLDNDRCPIVGGRRLIPTDYLPTVIEVLRDHDYLPPAAPTTSDADKPAEAAT